MPSWCAPCGTCKTIATIATIGALAAAMAVLAGPTPATAARDPRPAMCEAAAQRAAQATGVPLSVLRAISLTETGRRHDGVAQPWPWTVNMEGKGVWFDTEDAALAYVHDHYKAGARSFDVGCFQVNYHWHGSAFASIEQMFDPAANALYAARFLSALHDETGDWSKAAGAYHSRTPKEAKGYVAQFEKYREAIAGTPAAPAAPAPPLLAAATPARPERPNLYPLLQAGGEMQMGSLVPLMTDGPVHSLIGPADPQG